MVRLVHFLGVGSDWRETQLPLGRRGLLLNQDRTSFWHLGGDIFLGGGILLLGPLLVCGWLSDGGCKEGLLRSGAESILGEGLHYISTASVPVLWREEGLYLLQMRKPNVVLRNRRLDFLVVVVATLAALEYAVVLKVKHETPVIVQEFLVALEALVGECALVDAASVDRFEVVFDPVLGAKSVQRGHVLSTVLVEQLRVLELVVHYLELLLGGVEVRGCSSVESLGPVTLVVRRQPGQAAVLRLLKMVDLESLFELGVHWLQLPLVDRGVGNVVDHLI